MNTPEQTFSSRVIRRVATLGVYSLFLAPLVACSDTGADTNHTAADVSPSGLYADASSSASATTPGFVGEVLDATIRVSWDNDANATGYNIYRQGDYYRTVFSNVFHDTDVPAGTYSYAITAFKKNGQDTRYYSVARDLRVSISSNASDVQTFNSATTGGFAGEVLGRNIRVAWMKDPNATGYNVYRQGKYYATVFNNEFHDSDITAKEHSYEVTAFVKNGQDTRYYSVAKGLTVSVPALSVSTPQQASSATAGFVGAVQGNGIQISWKKDPAATGYNVYRQGKYYTTVFDTHFHDTDVGAQDYTYQITAFEKSGSNTRYYSIAEDLTVSGASGTGSTQSPAPPQTGNASAGSGSSDAVTPVVDKTPVKSPELGAARPIGGAYFESLTTEGFTGEVLDDAIRIRWEKDPAASGYNVYRQAEYYTTVFTNEFNDEDVYDQDYYYEIQAFEHRENGLDTRYYYIATGLTVTASTLGKTDPDQPQPNDALLKDYSLVFADEFNGDTLDASKWNTSFLWGTDLIINGEEQYYVDILKEANFGFNPFTFDGNHLTINTIKTPPKLAAKSANQPYLSGIITSYDAFKFTYGYAEVRARMTHGRGYWPAFWLLNAYYGGDDPEIDIMEFVGDNQDVVYHTFHYHDENGKLRSTQSKPTPGIDYTADFHTFSVEWKPGLIIYFVDGIEAHRITDPNVPQEQMYLIANTAVGGWWAGSPDESTPFPGKYVIDYIRVYQKATLYNDELYSDEMTGGLTDDLTNDLTDVPYADDIPGQAFPNHRPTREQWPAGYPYD